MENKNNKVVLITIIVLLCIFTPLTVVGLLTKGNVNPIEENPNHETFYDGYIWFYDLNNDFLSKYECLTEICEFTKPTIDDHSYGINYYKEGTINSVSLMNDKYTFITDGIVINLYAANTGTTLQTYKALKTYNTTLENNSFIVQNNEGVWGVISIGDTLGAVLPFEYSFIGLLGNLNEDGTLSTDKFIVQKDTKWYIVDKANNTLSGEIDDPIVYYTDKYIFSRNSEQVRIYGFDNIEYLEKYTIRNYILEDKYIGIITDNFLLIYDNLDQNYIKSVVLTEKDASFELEKVDNKLNIKINDEVTDTIELS